MTSAAGFCAWTIGYTLQLALYCCCYAQQNRPSENSTQTALTEKEFSDLVVKTYGYRRTLEDITLEDGYPVSVVDIVIPDYTPSSGLVVNRIVEVSGGFHSNVKLQLPAQRTSSTIDTSQWKIDKSFLFPHTYYIRMIEAIFRSDLIEPSQDSNAEILEIGLAGGTIDGFLHEVFPKMYITVVEISRKTVDMARKWFGLVEDDHYKVIVADGVDYLAERARAGTQYDAILIDACRSVHKEIINCPLEKFYSKEVLKDIAKLLPSQGILIINAWSPNMDHDQVYQLITESVRVFFAYCDRLDEPGSPNLVIYCLHRAPAPKPEVDIFKFFNDIGKNSGK